MAKVHRSVRQANRRSRMEVAAQARLIRDQEMLDTLLASTGPLERAEMIKMLAPNLPFIPKELSLDCEKCGRKNGQVMAHECSPAN